MLSKLHYVNVADKGTFKTTGQVATSPADVNAIFAELARTQASHLTLYFHGGLVSEEGGLKTAELFFPRLEAAGTYPVFFVWETGWQEIVGRNFNLEALSNNGLFKSLLETLLKFTVGKLKESSESRGLKLALPEDATLRAEVAQMDAPSAVSFAIEESAELSPVTEDQQEQLTDYMKDDPAFQQEANALRDQLETEADGVAFDLTDSNPNLLSEKMVTELRAEASGGRGLVAGAALIKATASIFARVINRFIQRTDHGVQCTVVEELLREVYLDKVGYWLWDEIKNAARDAFLPNTGLSGEKLHGGTYFLERLRDYLADPAHAPLKVSLVGHSAGNIYICRFIQKAMELLPATFSFYRVIMLAPACDFELFRNGVVAHKDRIEGYRLLNLGDAFERTDAIVPGVYPRSLVYFVAGVLEGDSVKPLVGLERCFSGQKPFDAGEVLAGRDYVFAANAQRFVVSQITDAAPGLNCNAKGHGDFSEEVTWESVKAILQG